MAISQILWKALYLNWPARSVPPRAGYSLLVPVPGDLPVFLKLALSVLRKQGATHRIETLVVPDVMTPRMREIVEHERASWPGELRLIEMPRPDRWFPKHFNRPHHNHWLQLINGARQARGQYALLHDADLFLTDAGFLKQQFERCIDGKYSCFGVHRVWDPWFEQQGKNLTATWEMFFDVDWLRSFPPHLHLGHDDVLDGKSHTFDTTLYPQCLTPADKIGWHSPAGGLVHFNYVICSYRYYLDRKGSYEDEQFRILLIRILIDLLDPEGTDYELPSVKQLQTGLTNSSAPVTYVAPATAKNYPEFRAKWEELLASGFLTAEQVAEVRRRLAPFDQQFSFHVTS